MYDFAPGMDHFADHREAMRLGALESMTAQVRTDRENRSPGAGMV
jgi:hypothetical protein